VGFFLVLNLYFGSIKYMECPNGHKKLDQILFHNVEVDYCPDCLGIWFDKDELIYAKDDNDSQLKWVDFDVWRHKEKFQAVAVSRRCPVCRIPFVQIGYDNSKVKVDYCKNCMGIWLDRGEFKQIMIYLKDKADYEILHHYTKNLIKQLWEVFTGPQNFREEVVDVMMVLKLLKYKLMVQHPHLEKIIEEDLPK